MTDQPVHPVAKNDIDATKAVLDLVFSGIATGKLAMQDGKLDFSDVQYLPGVLLAAGPAFEKLGQVPGELGDLDSEESAELLAYAGDRLPGLVGDDLAKKVNAALRVGVAIAEAVVAFRGVQVSMPV